MKLNLETLQELVSELNFINDSESDTYSDRLSEVPNLQQNIDAMKCITKELNQILSRYLLESVLHENRLVSRYEFISETERYLAEM